MAHGSTADPIEAAIQAGKIPPSRRPHYERLIRSDPEGTAALLARLAPALPVDEVRYAGGIEGEPTTGDAYPRQWLGSGGATREGSRIQIAHD